MEMECHHIILASWIRENVRVFSREDVGVHLGKVRLFLDGDGWGILVFFSKRKVGPPLC